MNKKHYIAKEHSEIEAFLEGHTPNDVIYDNYF